MYKEQSIAREDDKLSHLDVDFWSLCISCKTVNHLHLKL